MIVWRLGEEFHGDYDVLRWVSCFGGGERLKFVWCLVRGKDCWDVNLNFTLED